MEPRLLTSPQNPVIKKFRAALRVKQKDVFLLEGRHLMRESFRVRWPLQSVLVSKNHWEAWEAELEGAAILDRSFAVTPSLLASLSTVASPEGIIALALRQSADWPIPDRERRFVFLDAVQDPINVGILIRSAVAFGFSAAFCGTGTVDPFHPTALARSAGAALHLPVLSCTASAFIEWARDGGVRLFAAEAGGDPYNRHPPPYGPAALALGNEGQGLSMAVLEACHDRLGIPMADGWDSLNVAVAGGLLMHHLAGIGHGKP
jgi:TrmH family RNA methyltransferase